MHRQENISWILSTRFGMFRAFSRPPLTVAVINNDISQVKRLLKAGTTDTRDQFGYIALEYAIALGHLTLVEQLAAIGKSIDKPIDSKSVDKPIDKIESFHFARALELSFLLEEGRNRYDHSARENAFRTVKTLKTEGAMLKYAVSHRYEKFIKVLLERKTILSADKSKVLLEAVEDRVYPPFQIAMLLLQAGAVDMLGEDGSTTLEKAVSRSCHPTVIEGLLKCKPATEKNRGKALLAALALRRALRYPYASDTVVLLLKANAMKGLEEKELCKALSLMIDISDYNEGARLIIEQILKTDLSFPLDIRDEEGNTLLMRAAAKHRVNIVSLLVEAGATADAQNNENETALMLASKMEQPYFSVVNAKVIKLLVEAGSTVSLKNKQGQTAEMLAQHSPSKQILVNRAATQRTQFGNEIDPLQSQAWNTPSVREILTSFFKVESWLPNALRYKEIVSFVCDYLVPVDPNKLLRNPPKGYDDSPCCRLLNKISESPFPFYKENIITKFRRELMARSFSTSWWHSWNPAEIESRLHWAQSKKELDKLLLKGAKGKFGDCYRDILEELWLTESKTTNDNKFPARVP